MSEPSDEHKRKLYDDLPSEQKHEQTYTEWVKEGYNNQYQKWMPWIEEKYLALFGKDNKASYITKDTLNKTKITGIDQVDKLQGDVNSLVGNQFGPSGALGPLGDVASKEGINRAERGGKDETGSYGGPAAKVTDPVVSNAKGAGEGLASGAQSATSTVTEGAKSAGGYLGGIFGGGKK